MYSIFLFQDYAIHLHSATDDFNNGVILTNRTLRANEVFEVRLDRLVDKWAGSIEIGLTTHQPTELDFPSTMTNIRTGTWMMTGNGVMHNGQTIVEDYGQNLDRLKVRQVSYSTKDLLRNLIWTNLRLWSLIFMVL